MNEDRAPGVFIVDVAGLDLPREVQERIRGSIQKAVLAEIAVLDLATNLSVRFNPAELDERRGPIDTGQPWGAVMRPDPDPGPE